MTKNVLIVFVFAALVLTGCGSEGGGASSLRSRINGSASSALTAATPRPSETPDFGNAQPAMTAPTPAPVVREVEVTRETVREVPVVQTVEVPVVQESVREVVVTATPEPAPTCDPRTPAPTVALDESDRAAGVILRGQWPCYAGGE